MQLREVIVIPFRMSLMQCLFIGKVLCEDFEIHMLNLCSEIKVYDKVSEVSMVFYLYVLYIHS